MDKSVKKMKLLVVLIMLAMALPHIAGCGNPAQETLSSDTGKVKVAVSIVPQASFVEAVGGDLVEVVTMIPPGGNPENYAPSPKIMKQVSDAQIYFSVGVAAEQNGILPRLRQLNPDMPVIDLASRVDRVYPVLEIAPGQKDPHRWMSPRRVSVMVESIGEELAKADPDHAQIYRKNMKNYQQELAKLHQEIETSLAGVTNRSFIVYHPSMGYFASDYGLTMIALEEEGKAATAQHIQQLIDRARQENIKAIFYQAEMDGKQAQTLARELGGEAQLIAPLAPDYINNLRQTARTFTHVLNKK